MREYAAAKNPIKWRYEYGDTVFINSASVNMVNVMEAYTLGSNEQGGLVSSAKA